MYCMALENENLEIIKKLNYLPVGLKNINFSDEWLRDNTGDNISQKKSCEKAQERALNDARRKVSDEKISSQQSKTCTASEFKNECELFSDTWSYIDTVVLKSEPKKIKKALPLVKLLFRFDTFSS